MNSERKTSKKSIEIYRTIKYKNRQFGLTLLDSSDWLQKNKKWSPETTQKTGRYLKILMSRKKNINLII